MVAALACPQQKRSQAVEDLRTDRGRLVVDCQPKGSEVLDHQLGPPRRPDRNPRPREVARELCTKVWRLDRCEGIDSRYPRPAAAAHGAQPLRQRRSRQPRCPLPARRSLRRRRAQRFAQPLERTIRDLPYRVVGKPYCLRRLPWAHPFLKAQDQELALGQRQLVPDVAEIGEEVAASLIRLDAALAIQLVEWSGVLHVRPACAPIEDAALVQRADAPRLWGANVVPLGDREQQRRLHQVFRVLRWNVVPVEHTTEAAAEPCTERGQCDADSLARAYVRAHLALATTGRRLHRSGPPALRSRRTNGRRACAPARATPAGLDR